MRDRRESGRIPLATLLEVYSEEEKKSICRGFIKNLGKDGLAFETPKRLRLNGEFKLKFTLEDGRSFDILSEIKYIKEGVLTVAHGARFTNVNTEDSGKIEEYMGRKAGTEKDE